METAILIVMGIFVGLIVISQAFARPPQETIVIVPTDRTEPVPDGLGCLPLIAVGLVILLVLSTGR